MRLISNELVGTTVGTIPTWRERRGFCFATFSGHSLLHQSTCRWRMVSLPQAIFTYYSKEYTSRLQMIGEKAQHLTVTRTRICNSTSAIINNYNKVTIDLKKKDNRLLHACSYARVRYESHVVSPTLRAYFTVEIRGRTPHTRVYQQCLVPALKGLSRTYGIQRGTLLYLTFTCQSTYSKLRATIEYQVIPLNTGTSNFGYCIER